MVAFDKVEFLKTQQVADQQWEVVKDYIRNSDNEQLNILFSDLNKLKSNTDFNKQLIAALAANALVKAMEEVNNEKV